MKRVYGLMGKHYDKFVIDPSNKYEKVVDSNVGREVESTMTMTSAFRIVK